jgi:predicted site-specific integrase-resolvase
MGEIALAALGLLTAPQAAELRKVSLRTIQSWVRAGLSHVVTGAGRSKRYLFRREDVLEFQPKPRGAPKGNQFARKNSDAPKPENPRKSKDKTKKTRNSSN